MTANLPDSSGRKNLKVSTWMGCPLAVLLLVALSVLAREREAKYPGPLAMDVAHVSKDPSVNLDYPLVYVRAPRKEANGRSKWAEVGDPRSMEPGAELVLLQP